MKKLPLLLVPTLLILGVVFYFWPLHSCSDPVAPLNLEANQVLISEPTQGNFEDLQIGVGNIWERENTEGMSEMSAQLSVDDPNLSDAFILFKGETREFSDYTITLLNVYSRCEDGRRQVLLQIERSIDFTSLKVGDVVRGWTVDSVENPYFRYFPETDRNDPNVPPISPENIEIYFSGEAEVDGTLQLGYGQMQGPYLQLQNAENLKFPENLYAGTFENWEEMMKSFDFWEVGTPVTIAIDGLTYLSYGADSGFRGHHFKARIDTPDLMTPLGLECEGNADEALALNMMDGIKQAYPEVSQSDVTLCVDSNEGLGVAYFTPLNEALRLFSYNSKWASPFKEVFYNGENFSLMLDVGVDDGDFQIKGLIDDYVLVEGHSKENPSFTGLGRYYPRTDQMIPNAYLQD